MTNDEIEALEKRLRKHYQELNEEAADAIAHLRAEVERLTREMAQLQRFKWNDEQMRLLQARAEAAERERDAVSARLESALVEGAKRREERDAAERHVATLREALRPFSELHATRYMTNGCRYEFRVEVAWIRNARAALAKAKG